MIIHAFFKRMLFLATGSMMAQKAGGQDSRFYGGFLGSYVAFLYFIVRCLCLSGFPFFIGFYSKDCIILSSRHSSGVFFYVLFLVRCGFTVCYRVRLVYLAYSSIFNSFSFLSLTESNIFIFPVSLLFFCGWLSGGLFYWIFLAGTRICLCLFDLLVGVVLLFLGLCFFAFLSLSKVFVSTLLGIAGMRWIKGGLSSSVFESYFLHKIEGR